MSERELTPPVGNILLFKREDIARSIRGIHRLIRKFNTEARLSTDQDFIRVRREKISKLEIIGQELKILKDQL